MFSGTVHSVEGLFVQQHHKAVAGSDAVHQVHNELVLVVGQVGFPEDGGHFKLAGSHLVVAGFQRNAQVIGGKFQVPHEGGYARGDGGEVVVVQLLVLGGVVAEQGASGEHQVCAGRIEGLVHQEVLLLPAQVGIDPGYFGVKEFANRDGGVTDRFEGTLEGRFVVQGVSGVGDEDGGDTEGVVQDENRGGRVPGRVAAGFEGGPDASAGEGGSVGFLLGQHLAVEGFDDTALAVIVNQGVVFFGRSLREGLEPVRDVGDAVFHGPFFHSEGYAVGGFVVQAGAAFHTGIKGLESTGLQILSHFLAVENKVSEVVGRFAGRSFGLFHFAGKGFPNQL